VAWQAKTEECDLMEERTRRLTRELDTTRQDAEGAIDIDRVYVYMYLVYMVYTNTYVFQAGTGEGEEIERQGLTEVSMCLVCVV
jgi:hypothetical protein